MGKFKEEIRSDLSSIKTILAGQHETLREHIRRTEALENKMEPVEKHVNMVEGVIKFLGFCVAIGLFEGLRVWFH